ncbi:rod shape-determining protein RodA [Nevskia soli]|jgi:rod shape determining protein RodA|uniref:rod shape-determining protein RodA n=1 Tax=Nevskia soli TaxID=418856 RepID=UPI0015D68960|nr:rod shape-determining protein RodA [Nevskia soli]
MPGRRLVRDLDWAMLSIVFIICGIGIVQIYSATRGTTFQDTWWKQIVYIGMGVILMWITTAVDYHALIEQANVYYVVAVAGLLGVLVMGKTVLGGKRWIPLPGGLNLQVSEFAKLVILLIVARQLTRISTDVLEFRDFLRIVVVVLVPMALIAAEPDLGTALTYLPILGIGVFLAGLRWQYWAAIAVITAVVVPLGFEFMKDYQRNRLLSFVDPDRDPKGTGYQLIQSRISVGAGGMWGKGVTKGSQTQLGFLPIPHTDFIFSAFAEEHGFVGVTVVLSLYFVLLMQIVQNAQTAPDRAGMFLCMGVAALLLFHLLVNVGMVVGRMPVTGIPLPLMSYGGSSLWSVFMMLGLVNNVRLRRFVN